MGWVAPPIARVDEPFVGDERAMPPSRLSLLGLVRHVADVERTWLRRRFGGEDVAALHWRADAPNAAFEEIDPERADDDLAALVAG